MRILMQNLKTGNVCRVAEAVAVGFVAVVVGVDDVVGDNVAVTVAGSSVEVCVAVATREGVGVDVTAGVNMEGHANISKRISPMVM